jgi:hypothetical protein
LFIPEKFYNRFVRHIFEYKTYIDAIKQHAEWTPRNQAGGTKKSNMKIYQRNKLAHIDIQKRNFYNISGGSEITRATVREQTSALYSARVDKIRKVLNKIEPKNNVNSENSPTKKNAVNGPNANVTNGRSVNANIYPEYVPNTKPLTRYNSMPVVKVNGWMNK